MIRSFTRENDVRLSVNSVVLFPCDFVADLSLDGTTLLSGIAGPQGASPGDWPRLWSSSGGVLEGEADSTQRLAAFAVEPFEAGGHPGTVHPGRKIK